MRPRLVAFAVAVAVAVAGMAWISWTALRLDAEEAAARRRAHVEENARLALWRMDTTMAPIIAREAARPVETWTSTPVTDGEILRYEERGNWAAPAELESAAQVASRQMEKATKARSGALDEQQYKNYVEFNARADVLSQNEGLAPPAATPLAPAWVDGELALVRNAGARGTQLAFLDWKGLRARLVGEIRELLPDARLEPATDDDDERRLASLPVRLIPGDLAIATTRTPVPLILSVAWTGFLVAAVAVAVLLVGTLRLGERRRAFVSTVTHELRTPLTTLQTYSEMLADGMIKDEEKRAQYLGTLRDEASRLGHLVENVLAYSRIEQGRGGDKTRVVTAGSLVDGAKARLGEVVVEGSSDARVHADPLAVEQILINLVDNARKYGRAPIHVAASGHEIRVWDQGPGVVAADRKELFTPFHKSVQRAAVSAPGVGLGLALSRRLARAMGGDLRHDGGSTFVLTLRRASP